MDQINKYSDYFIALNRAEEYIGKRVLLLKSTKPSKKFMILIDGKWIHFGKANIIDFTKDFNRKRREIARQKINMRDGIWKHDKYHPINLSLNILW